MSIRCPVCKGDFAPGDEPQWFPDIGVLIVGTRAATLTLTESKIFGVLWDALQEGQSAKISKQKLMETMYEAVTRRHTTKMSKSSLAVRLTELRIKIEPLGFVIANISRAGMYLFYRKKFPVPMQFLKETASIK